MKPARVHARVAVVAAGAVAVAATKPEQRRMPLPEQSIKTALSSSISMMRTRKTKPGGKPLPDRRQVRQRRRPRRRLQRARRFLWLRLSYPRLSKRLGPHLFLQ
jgi:hypothetical protein